MDNTVIRTFIPGSPWLYYKIYSGTTTANLVLTEIIGPLAQRLKRQEVVLKWFFIRYHDPEPHLRVRFWVKDVAKLGVIMTQMQQHLQPYIDQELVWKLQLDTYNRELERYGAASIEEAEALFYHDSILVTHALAMIEDSDLKLFFALKRIDQLLENFGLNTADKLRLVQHNGKGFKQEFNANKHTNKQLDGKYRKHRKTLEEFMILQEHEDYEPLLQLLQYNSEQQQPVIQSLFEKRDAQTLEVSIENLLGSYIHMFVNRYYDTRQRLHEMVCYDYLDRYYRALVGREHAVKNSES